MLSREREPTIQGWIEVEERLWAWKDVNHSHYHCLDLQYGNLSVIRDLMDIQPLGDLYPSLCYGNQVKSDAQLRLSSEYHVKARSETAEGFPPFINTILESSLYLHAQDSDYVF
jgi:hypothetical protein